MGVISVAPFDNKMFKCIFVYNYLKNYNAKLPYDLFCKVADLPL